MTVGAAQTCGECHYGLSVDSSGSLVCFNRHCPEFDRPIEEDDARPYELVKEDDGDVDGL